jgi:PadR family transcriptional regulator, regulatory protein PadR
VELIQGTLDMLVLKALTWGRLHGYGIGEEIHRRSGSRLRIEEGALYPALHRLEARGLLSAEWGVSENNRKARFYKVTAKGRAYLKAETHHFLEYARAVTALLQSA